MKAEVRDKAGKGKEPVSRNGAPAKFEAETFFEAIREMNNEVLQIEELRNHTEKLKEDLVCYVTGILRTYDLYLMVPTSSLPNTDDVRAMYFNGAGNISYQYLDGSIKSYRLLDYPPPELLNILSAAMPSLKAALVLKRKEYEKISNLLAKIGKQLLLKEEAIKPTKQLNVR